MKSIVLKNLKADNVFNLKAIDITPNDDGVTLIGKNGSGKSSVLNSIDVLVRGMKFAPDKLIREGEDKAVIEGDFGDFKVKRTITEKSMRLEITTPDGLAPKKPQEYLDALYGKQFDLVELINQKPKEQRQMLMNLVGVDVDSFDQRIKVIYDERTQIGREGQTLSGQLNCMAFTPGAPETEINPADLLTQLREAQEHNRRLDEIKRAENDAAIQIEDINNANKLDFDTILRIEKEIEHLTQKAIDIQAEIDARNNTAESIANDRLAIQQQLKVFQLADTVSIEQQISGCQAKNQIIRDNKRYTELKAQVTTKAAEYEAKTKAIQEIEQEKKSVLEQASFPIEGLSFGNDCILYNGIPLDQASDAQKILVAMSIFMALNPGLKIIRINRGALIDDENLKLAREFAKSKGYQAWIEEITEREANNGSVIIEIENGEIKQK